MHIYQKRKKNCTHGCINVITQLVKQYNELLDIRSSGRGRYEVTYVCTFMLGFTLKRLGKTFKLFIVVSLLLIIRSLIKILGSNTPTYLNMNGNDQGHRQNYHEYEISNNHLAYQVLHSHCLLEEIWNGKWLEWRKHNRKSYCNTFKWAKSDKHKKRSWLSEKILAGANTVECSWF